MTEEIYLDGVLMEREVGATPLQLVYQSPMLTSIDAIMSNRTNSVTFPLTDGNRRAIGYAAEQTDALFPYRRHNAIYKRDGVQIFDGYGILLSIGTDTFDMSFVWGNVSAFAQLKDLKLRSLQTDAAGDYETLPPTSMAHSPYSVNFGAGRCRPAVKANEVLGRIESVCGLTGLTTEGSGSGPFSLYALPLTNKVGDANTRLSQAFAAYDGLYERNGQRYQFTRKEGAVIFDPNGTFTEDNELACEDASSLLFRIINGLTLCVKLTWNDVKHWPSDTAFAKFSIIGVADGVETELLSHPYTHFENPPAEFRPGEVGRILWCTLTLPPIVHTINIADYDTIYFSLLGVPPTGMLSGIEFFNSGTYGNIYACLDPTTAEDAVYNTYGRLSQFSTPYIKHYPIFSNLPDWTAAEFLKQLMLLEGVFAYADSPTHVTFVSVKTLTDNKALAQDWTDRMLTLKPSERRTVLDGTAEKNRCVYAGDDTRANGVIDSDDETLDYEKDYIKSSFAASVGNRITQYTEGEDGKITESSITQRILKMHGVNQVPGAVFDGRLEWNTLLARPAYAALVTLMNKPHIIKATIICDSRILSSLDMLKPIALRQTGRYYALRTLTTKDNGTAEVELIQL